MPDDPARPYTAANVDYPSSLVEEEDVQLEAHTEGVDARAAWEQQPGPGLVPVAEGEAAQPGSEILCNGDECTTVIHLPISHTGRHLSPSLRL